MTLQPQMLGKPQNQQKESHTQFPFQDKVAIRRGGLKHLHSQSLNSTFILIVLQGSGHPVTLTSYMP